MKIELLFRQAARRCLAFSLGLALCASAAHAQTPTGTVTGRVYNPATGEYVRNAEVRLEGTNRIVTTEADGSFTLTNVPAGPAKVNVSYTGYDNASASVNVAAGDVAKVDVNLTNSLYKAESDNSTVKMQAFTVSTEREGNAKAIMDQRRSMNVSNIVAAETFGNTSEGNVGEFLKYLPGIQLDYVEADARNPRIRGLPAQYTTVTFGGMDLASADGFIQNNGTDNGGGAGVGGRSFGFEQVSMASVDAVEVNYTVNASQPASSAAGVIDLRPKHAYERNGQRINVDFSAMANGEELFWHKVVKPDDHARRLIEPNFSFDYQNSFLHNRLGLLFSVNESNIFNEQRQYVPTYDTNATAADPRPIVITRIQYKDGPKLTERSTLSFTLDFKATDRLSLSLIGTLNNYGMMTSNRSFGVTSTRANIKGDGWTSWDDATITAITNSWSYLRKRTHGYTYLPSFEYKTPRLLLTGAAVVSQSENNYAGNESYRLPGSNIGGVSIPVTGMHVTASRGADDLYAWRVVETAGQDWANLSNYKASATGAPTFGFDGRYNRVLKYQLRTDAKYTTSLDLPTYLQTGINVNETTYIYQNPTSWQTWNYVGPGGGPSGSWSAYPSAAQFSPGHGGYLLSTSGGTAAIADHNTIGNLFMEHPEYFVQPGTAANYLTSFVQQPKYIREQVDAGYGMFDTKPISKLEIQAGVRWERTRDETKDFNQIPASKVIAAGFPVTASTGIASTIPGIQYQYFSTPRIARSNSYDALFPSASVKYSINPNLQALVGYSYTTTRPAFGDLSGTYSENETTQEISAPNPLLKPQYSDNYSARLMYYFEPVGVLGVGVFENDIKNFVQSTRLAGAAADYGFTDPIYDNYTVVTKTNIGGKVLYRGATVEYNQSLSFLPRPFNGFSVFANYTRTYTEMKVPDPSLLHVSGAYNFGWIPGVAPHVINAGVNFRYRSFGASVNAHWTADTPTTSTYNTWMNQSTKLDVKASYNITNRYSVYFYSRNITNEPDHTYIGTNRQQIGGGRAIEYYGAYLYAGVKATF